MKARTGESRRLSIIRRPPSIMITSPPKWRTAQLVTKQHALLSLIIFWAISSTLLYSVLLAFQAKSGTHEECERPGLDVDLTSVLTVC